MYSRYQTCQFVYLTHRIYGNVPEGAFFGGSITSSRLSIEVYMHRYDLLLFYFAYGRLYKEISTITAEYTYNWPCAAHNYDFSKLLLWRAQVKGATFSLNSSYR